MMAERVFFESQALLAALAEGQEILAVETNKAGIIEQIPPKKAEALNEAIAALFADGRLADAVTVQNDVAPPSTADGFGWRLGRKVAGGMTRRMKFYQAKSVWKTQVGSLIGIAVALALTPLNPLAAAGAIAPTFILVSSAWDKFITLERPRDTDAIDTYEALLRAEIVLNGSAPTADQINGASNGASFGSTVAGLRRLKELGLVEVVTWEDEEGAINKPGNRWYQQF
jgi:hypothetical protein